MIKLDPSKLPAAPREATAPEPTRPLAAPPQLARDLMGPPPAVGERVLTPRDPTQVEVARAVTTLDGLTHAVEAQGLGEHSGGRLRQVAALLERLAARLGPHGSGPAREAVAPALERLRDALVAAAPATDVDPGALDAFVKALTLRAYDLGIEGLGLHEADGAIHFTTGAATLASVPEGVSAMPGAPEVLLADGTRAVPGQFRQYRLTTAAIQALVAEITLPPELVVFVGQDPGDKTPYVQIGVLGPDNYGHRETNPDKLVYGRRWRVEPSLPDYEVVQTVFAAARDARDHELREMFQVEGRTPFSGHVDAEVLTRAQATGTLVPRPPQAVRSLADVQAVLDETSLAGRALRVLEVEHRARTGTLSVVFEAVPPADAEPVPLVDGVVFEARAETATASGVLHAVMEELRRASLRELEETFAFRGDVRYSRDKDVQTLGDFSALTRSPKALVGGPLGAAGVAYTLAVEQARAPVVAPGPATDRAFATLTARAPLLGIPPKRSGGGEGGTP